MSYIRPKTMDDPELIGEDITRTSEPNTELFWCDVVFVAGPSMRCTVRARDSRQALRFALARHPGADPNRTRIMAGPHALITHVAFGQWLLEQQGKQEEQADG
jgi:hypothetical protein